MFLLFAFRKFVQGHNIGEAFSGDSRKQRFQTPCERDASHEQEDAKKGHDAEHFFEIGVLQKHEHHRKWKEEENTPKQRERQAQGQRFSLGSLLFNANRVTLFIEFDDAALVLPFEGRNQGFAVL